MKTLNVQLAFDFIKKFIAKFYFRRREFTKVNE